MIIKYREKYKKSKQDRKCYWCEETITKGTDYKGVVEISNNSEGHPRNEYRVECDECNKLIEKVTTIVPYSYRIFYAGEYRQTLKEYLREHRCKGCKYYELHETEGFKIKCRGTKYEA